MYSNNEKKGSHYYHKKTSCDILLFSSRNSPPKLTGFSPHLRDFFLTWGENPRKKSCKEGKNGTKENSRCATKNVVPWHFVELQPSPYRQFCTNWVVLLNSPSPWRRSRLRHCWSPDSPLPRRVTAIVSNLNAGSHSDPVWWVLLLISHHVFQVSSIMDQIIIN